MRNNKKRYDLAIADGLIAKRLEAVGTERVSSHVSSLFGIQLMWNNERLALSQDAILFSSLTPSSDHCGGQLPPCLWLFAVLPMEILYSGHYEEQR